MGNPFGNLTTEGLEETQDRLGGYAAKETDIYTGKIKVAYAGKSSGGANSFTVILSGGDFGDTEYRETLWVTSKKGDNFFLNKEEKKVPLPGYTVADDICLATIGKGLPELGFEDKMVNIYDADAGKEIPKSVPVAIDLIGQEVSLAILKSTENKTEKVGDSYVAKADGSTRDVNTIEKVFNTATKLTVAEARGGATEAKFWDAWSERNKGKTRDKTEATAGTNGKPGQAPQAGAGGGAPRTSLFGGTKA